MEDGREGKGGRGEGGKGGRGVGKSKVCARPPPHEIEELYLR